MEGSTRFWTDWTRGKRILLVVLAVSALGLMTCFAALFFEYPGPSIGWQSQLTEDATETPIQQLVVGPYQLNIKASNFVIWEVLEGTRFNFQTFPWYLFTGIMVLCISLLLAVHSTFARWWYYSFSGLILFAVHALYPEALLTNWRYPLLTGLIFLFWMAPGIVLQHFFNHISFLKRILIFSATTSISITALAFLSTEPEPVILIGVGFLPTALLLGIVFIVLSAHEFLAALVRWIGRSGGENNLRDFVLLSVIYLANLAAIYMDERGWLNWPYSIDPLFLILFCGVLGIWGGRHANRQDPMFLPTEDMAVFVRLILLIVALAGISLMYATANDAVIHTSRRLALYAQLGFGLVFLFYIILNFGQLLLENRPIQKILYLPKVVSYTFFLAGGVLATITFIVFNIWTRPINDLRGGYFNAVGDYYTLTGQTRFSDAYYGKAADFAFHNQHSNYIQAARAHDRNDYKREIRLWNNAAERRPLEQAYVNLGNLFLSQNRPLDAYTHVMAGSKRLPESKRLHQMLGLIEFQLGSLDSARWNFSLSGSPGGLINETALLAREDFNVSADSIFNSIASTHHAVRANVVALANRQHTRLRMPLPLSSDTILNLASATLLHNYIVNQSDTVREETIKLIRDLARKPCNAGYSESLHAALAMAAFRQGMAGAAFELMERATIFSDIKGRHNNQLATWALALGAPETALLHSRHARAQNYPDAAVTHAIALTEAGRHGEAMDAWEEILATGAPHLKDIAKLSIKILSTSSGITSEFSDIERYAWCRYHPKEIRDSTVFRRILGFMSNPDLKARSVLDLATWYLRQDKVNESVKTYRMLTGMPIADEHLFHEIQMFELRLLAWRGELRTLAQQINQGFEFLPTESTEKHYFTAILSAGDTAKVNEHMNWIVENNLWFEDGALRAAGHYHSTSTDPMAGNSILAKAMHLNPFSIRIRKAYVSDCIRLGLNQAADIALSDLAKFMDERDFEAFRAGLPYNNPQP